MAISPVFDWTSIGNIALFMQNAKLSGKYPWSQVICAKRLVLRRLSDFFFSGIVGVDRIDSGKKLCGPESG
jgi:hypothetical protein